MVCFGFISAQLQYYQNFDSLLLGDSMGAGSNVTLGTKNTVPMSANTSSCPQTRDNTTGLVYQQAPCNNKNALLVTLALCIPDDFAYELFVTTGEIPPTPESYVYKTVLTNDQKRDGVFSLSLSNKDFAMPARGSGIKCNLGVRPYTGEFKLNKP